ncbi:Exodeoxyribonuclease V gamma chain [Phocoenobacter uteri]|uniref:RecBCD enzyme subunit RecC n=1 Tax=Phocoenobacter uteri TaxID=146806 RepID=A0A379CAX8_9PAST|nr:exodeoxyribonuclease V subunit gamma [Phocoenobacter uteri]MDG6881441.1 hypothetical protein [Phocoenobacter uteri]SUB59470.1 Exodeoxyribonuclease V gamma chain [Phocoenobacter uteri]
MFTVYYSNQLEIHKEFLLRLLKLRSNANPFEADTILVQSSGMAQWLQMEIAQEQGIAANLEFPFPTRFLWQQYRNLLPNLPKENIFAPHLTVWEIMQLIPNFVKQEAFKALRLYLGENAEQYKLYQLAKAVADLFDQYLVYRPHWLICWENNKNSDVLNEIIQQNPTLSNDLKTHIQTEIQWQSQLWNALVGQLKQKTTEAIFNTSHRAYFQQFFFDKLENLTEFEKQKLPERIFIFGISSLPISQLDTLEKLSQYCDVHLFFLNPSQYYWGNILEQKTLDKMALSQKSIQVITEGNSLLATWGKQGRDFLNTLMDFQNNEHSFYHSPIQDNSHLLAQIQQSLLDLEDNYTFNIQKTDRSLQIHSCHSPLREVEVLHDQLLHLFEQNPELLPKDIIVMSPNIDFYAPYITAVFEQFKRQDPRYIPYCLCDQSVQAVDPIIHSFLSLLKIKEAKFSGEEILALLDITAIQKRYQFSTSQIEQLRYWINQAGIRSGLVLNHSNWQNYNSWENGLNRLLLGSALKEENGVWQESVAVDESYGLNAEISGQLNQFICKLSDWITFISESHSMEQWQTALLQLLNDFYFEDETNTHSLLQLHNAIAKITENITACQFDENISDEIIISLLNDQLEENKVQLNFLAGRVNFATLLPMRAIPFKVVCLLGMNEKDFPRQYHQNNFNLMNYAPQKGDRAKRDDDRYLFLEALLSAQDIFYISYVGQNLTKNQAELPSVLVSQLCDYLSKNQPENFFEKNVIHHPMTPFSPDNFKENSNASYAQHWLDTLTPQQIQPDFLTSINHQAEITQLDLDDLIRFLQQPIKYFFNHHLGIHFSSTENNSVESEPFILSNLEKYQLNDQLLTTNQQNFDDFFEKEKYKGSLPVNAFGKISKTQLIEELQPLYDAMEPYLTKKNETKTLEYTNNFLILNANLHFSQNNQVVLYRVGDLRDKDIIQAWLYHLMLQLQYPNSTVIFFFKPKKAQNKVGKLTFNPVDNELAAQLLNQYIQDYLYSFSELKWGISQELEGFFKEKADENNEEFTQNYLNKLISNDRDQDRIYLQRITTQTSGLNYSEIYQKTQQWFEVMWNNKIIQ